MLISDVINARAIAAVATNNASNAIPYLGNQWFPERKKAGEKAKTKAEAPEGKTNFQKKRIENGKG